MHQTNRTSEPSHSTSSFRRSGHLCVLLLLSLLPARHAAAQTGGAAPPNNAPGRPAGSYQLGGFDNLNLFNGNLNFSLPLLTIGGRGAAQVPITLSVDSTRWKLGRDGGVVNNSAGLNLNADSDIDAVVNIVEFTNGTSTWICRCSDEAVGFLSAYNQIIHQVRIDRTGDGLSDGGGSLTNPLYYTLDPDGWQGAQPGYGPGVVQGRIAFRRSGRFSQVTAKLTRIVFTAPDGTEYELRDRATYGRPFLVNQTNPPRGSVFVSADGTATTFVADAAVTDNPTEMGATFAGDTDDSLAIFAPDGYLLFADGTRYRVNDGRIDWMRDRNGNTVTFGYDSEGRVTGITDSLGRVVTVGYFDRQDPADPTKTVRDYDLISFAGFRGQPRSIIVRHKKLSEGGVLRADFPAGDSYRTPATLFPQYEQAGGTQVFDRDVVTAVELPDGRRYDLLYNHHGEIARVALPAGGAIEYDYHSASNSLSVQRAMWRRRVYEGGGGVSQSGAVGTPTLTQTYKAVLTGSVYGEPYRTVVTAEQWQGPDGAADALLTRERHHFSGLANAVQAGFYSPAKEGREEKVETLDTAGAADTAAVLSTATYLWRQRPAATDSPQEGWNESIPRDLRLVETLTALENGLTSKSTSLDPADPSGAAVGYDRFNNQTDLWEYDYKTAGETWRLLRRTRMRYVQTASVNGTTYDYACDPATTCGQPVSAVGLIHLRRLPESVEVIDGATGGVASRSEFAYDETTYSSDDYGNLPAGFPGWAAPVTVARGNPTTTRPWLSTLGAHDNPQAYLQTHAKHDRFGNVIKSWDARGNTSEVEFAAGYKYALPTTTTSADPDGGGPLTPLVTTNVYDLASGLITATIDVNNETTFFDYETGAGKLDRLKKVRRPDGGWTSYDYGDQAGNLYVYTRTLRESGPPEKILEGYQFFDGLGRATRSTARTGENVWAASATQFDALSRVAGVTNPYETSEHTGQVPQSALWTTTGFDALGRPWQTQTPDGAKVVTHFDGNRTLVTDQADKQRLSRSDALGRLTEVWEVRSEDAATGTEGVSFPHHDGIPDVSAGYRTAYTYDVLDNVRKVEQGVQRRYFAHDSLSRLLRSKNPEQTPSQTILNALRLPAWLVSPASDGNDDWSVKYEYDEVGNLRRRVDPRGTQTEYFYDALNRLTSKGYSDPTPDVTYVYGDDPAANTKGRLVSVGNGVSTYSYGAFDAAGRVTASSQTTGGVTYAMPEYVYDKAGNLVSERFPSGKVVETQFDDAGRAAGVRRQGGSYYAGGDPGEAGRPNVIRYAAHGGVAALRLGNGLWEHALYNARLQPYEIGLGASSADSSLFKLEYGYGLTGGGATDSVRNNGSVRGQKISVPAEGTAPARTYTQVFTYDALNRLEAAEETAGAVTAWRQVYVYDRFGNRRLEPARTTTPKLTTPGQTALPAVANPALQTLTNRIAEDQDDDGDKEYAFDEAGNLTCDPQACAPAAAPTPFYGFDAENRMVAVGGGFEAGGTSYSYDGDGRRVKKATYDGEATVFVYNAAGRLVAEYSNRAEHNGTRYLTQDHLGSTRVVTDAQGNAHSDNGAGGSRHDYYPFGQEIEANFRGGATQHGYGQANNVRHHFTGKERDSETGLDYFGARYYASAQGRFSSIDPVTLTNARLYDPQRFNLYAYCRNNPLLFVDPTGEDLILANKTAEGRGRANIDRHLRENERKNVEIQGNKVRLIDPKGIDLSTSSPGYKYLYELVGPGAKKTVYYYGLVPGESATGAASGVTMTYKEAQGGKAALPGGDKADVFVPVDGGLEVLGSDGQFLGSDEYIVFGHEVYGHGLCGRGQCAVDVENELRQERGLPTRSGQDHESLPGERPGNMGSTNQQVIVTAPLTPIPVESPQVPATTITPRPLIPLPTRDNPPR